MKIYFEARFRRVNGYTIETGALSDALLIFLPKELKVVECRSSTIGKYFKVSMETEEPFLLSEFTERLLKNKGIVVDSFTYINREFEENEKEKLKTKLLFHEVISSEEGKKK